MNSSIISTIYDHLFILLSLYALHLSSLCMHDHYFCLIFMKCIGIYNHCFLWLKFNYIVLHCYSPMQLIFSIIFHSSPKVIARGAGVEEYINLKPTSFYYLTVFTLCFSTLWLASFWNNVVTISYNCLSLTDGCNQRKVGDIIFGHFSFKT